MSGTPGQLQGPQEVARPGPAGVRPALLLAIALLAATFFLISPPAGKTYPGAIPWSDLSLLRPLIDLMSLYGVAATGRGVEIKEFAFHLAAALGLLLVGLQRLRASASRARSSAGTAAMYAQVLLGGWVLLSLLSTLWSGDPGLSAGQASLYALSLGWAVALGQTLERRDAVPLLGALVAIAALGAALAVWYHYERNPYHRVGFPIGNPTTLAAAIVPAVLIAATLVLRTLWISWRQRRSALSWPAAGAAVALVPLLWCLFLTSGRGALLALLAGLAVMLTFQAGRRSRRLVIGLVGLAILIGGGGLFYASRLDVTMARGATIRFRLYAWRYAAELWNTREVVGHGAGAYPRLAGQYAVRDQALDPGAFMGEIVEHAHNELFEVLSEIGLVGGVTYVAGFVATFFAAAALLRRRAADPQRWLWLALVGGIAALLADGMVGVTQRLPGVPAVLFTLLGVVWAVCRAGPPRDASPGEGAPSPDRKRGRPGSASVIVAVLCVLAAGGAGWLALRNWHAVRMEYAAGRAAEEGRYEAALARIVSAEAGLLDPVQKLNVRDRAARWHLVLAHRAFAGFAQPTATGPSVDRWQHAVALARAAHERALLLKRSVPASPRSDVIVARSAELLAELHRVATQPQLAREWSSVAERAWRRQRQRMPYDVETLLALSSQSYHPTLPAHISLLRDALRFRDDTSFANARVYWLDSLTRAAQRPGFEETLAVFVLAAGPITPETDLDAIIASMAPEARRLKAAWHGLAKDYGAAADQSAHAAELYQAVRARFPKLYPTALAEQADYLLRAAPENATRAVGLLRTAIDALPRIQEQKYEDMLRPFRVRLAVALLASGAAEEALAVVRAGLGEAAGEPRVVERALQTLLGEAAKAGADAAELDRTRRALCAEFPRLCESDEDGGQR